MKVISKGYNLIGNQLANNALIPKKKLRFESMDLSSKKSSLSGMFNLINSLKIAVKESKAKLKIDIEN